MGDAGVELWEHGIRWGPLEVTLMVSDPKAGWILSVHSRELPTNRAIIRTSPKGRSGVTVTQTLWSSELELETKGGDSG